MPLFECTECSVVENTALCDYWVQQKEHYEETGSLEGFAGICSECRSGKWHGEFGKRTVDEANLIEDEHGYLVHDQTEDAVAKMFTELIAECIPSEQARILAGCRDGYFAPEPQHRKAAEIADAPPTPTKDPDADKRRKERLRQRKLAGFF